MTAPEIAAALERNDPGNLRQSFGDPEDGLFELGVRLLAMRRQGVRTLGGACLEWWAKHGTADPFTLARIGLEDLRLFPSDPIELGSAAGLAAFARVAVTAELGHREGGWLPELDWEAVMARVLSWVLQ